MESAETTPPKTDLGLGEFDPWPESEVHVEWGFEGASLAAQRGDVIVVVDVLSFSTTVSVALDRGAAALSLSRAEIDEMGGDEAVGERFGAFVVAKRRHDPSARFTLSPASLGNVEPGDRLVLTSLNGAKMVRASTASPVLITGALRSATATANLVSDALNRGLASRATIVACGEHWSSAVPGRAGIRPGLEDQLGAGAIAAGLADPGRSLSAEADAAAAMFTATSSRLTSLLLSCVSGRELVTSGFGEDVEIAAQLDASNTGSLRHSDGFFRAAHDARAAA